MKNTFLVVSACLMLTSFSALAQDAKAPAKPLAHESEAAIVSVGGNKQVETYSVKQRTSYTLDQNALTLEARYLMGKTSGVETAKSWDGTLRYDRILSDLWSVYASHILESDIYAGYVQRTSYGAGAKYQITKTESDNWFAEAGYRYTFAQFVDPIRNGVNHYGRTYTEWNHAWSKGVSGKIWVEYLPNFTDPNAYLLNYEPSLNVILSDVFGLKIAYLVKYQNSPGAGLVNSDTTYSTALTAKL